MKVSAIFRPALGLFILLSLFSCMTFSSQKVQAIDNDDPYTSGKYSREELAQMLAPIALYPDALLAQVLMASTYPVEVVEADRWIRRNPSLKGEDLDAAILDIDWDPSVKAVCHFPSILSLMSERITETTHLGDAFLGQEAEVMDMVQELRAKAHAQNKLVSDSRQKVIVEREKIIIVPADPEVIYVSYYDPSYVYGPWWYPAYPPYYWGPPGVRIGSGVSYWPAFHFGFAFGTWSYFDWHRHHIHIHKDRRPRYVRRDRWVSHTGPWLHAPVHRRGVVYRHRSSAWKYGQQDPQRYRELQREPRGFPEPRERSPDRRFEERNRLEPNSREVDRMKIDRRRPEPERIDRNRQGRERTDRDHQERSRVGRDELEQQQIERSKQGGEQDEVDRRMQENAERNRQERERVEIESKERERAERGKLEQQQVERARREGVKAERDRQERERVEGEQQRRGVGDFRDRSPNDRGRGSRRESNDHTQSRGGGPDDQVRGERNGRGHSGRGQQ